MSFHIGEDSPFCRQTLVGVATAISALLNGETVTISGWNVAPFAPLSYRLDPLAAFFVLVISVPAIPVAWYGVGYLNASHVDSPEHASRSTPSRVATDALLAMFLASMTLVVL